MRPLTSATEIPGTAYSYSYDLAGNRIDGGKSYDAANQVVGWSYDAAGNLTNDGAATYTYDAYNRLTARGTTLYAYDAADQQTQAIDALGRTTAWQYDAQGRVTAQLDPRGSAYNQSFGYDGMDSRTQTLMTIPPTPITAQYDALGRRLALTDATGITRFTYDPLGRITQVQAPQTGTLGYGYDAAGRRTQLTYPNGTVTALPNSPAPAFHAASSSCARACPLGAARLSAEREPGASISPEHAQSRAGVFELGDGFAGKQQAAAERIAAAGLLIGAAHGIALTIGEVIARHFKALGIDGRMRLVDE